MPDRGAGPHRRVGDLPRDRAGGDRAGPVQPAGQGPRPAGPGPPGGAQGHGPTASRPPGRRSAAGWPRTCRSATRRPASCSSPGPPSPGSGPASWWRPAGAGKANHAEFQAVPGLLCATVPDGVPAAGRGVHHDRRHRAAWPAAGRGGPGIEGRGAGARPDRPAGRAAGARGRLRGGGDRSGGVPAADGRRLRGTGPGRDAATPPPTRCSAGPGAGARTPCWSARRAAPRTR